MFNRTRLVTWHQCCTTEGLETATSIRANLHAQAVMKLTWTILLYTALYAIQYNVQCMVTEDDITEIELFI